MNISGFGQQETVFADRYLYIPSIASCVLIACLIQSFWRRRLPREISFWKKQAAYLSVAPVLVVYGSLLVHSSFLWKDPVTFYTKSLERSPDIEVFTHLLAQYYYKQGDLQKAEPLFHRAIQICKRTKFLMAAYNGLGAIEFGRGHFDAARQNFEKGYNLKPDDASSLQNLASIYLMQQNYPAASKLFESALKANPRDEAICNNMAAMYIALKQYDQAIASAQKAIELFPKFGQAYINMAQAYAEAGMKEQAIAAYRKAMEVEPSKRAIVEEALKKLEK
jgi:tetratricopeptide (TPR) repeat protein